MGYKSPKFSYATLWYNVMLFISIPDWHMRRFICVVCIDFKYICSFTD